MALVPQEKMSIHLLKLQTKLYLIRKVFFYGKTNR